MHTHTDCYPHHFPPNVAMIRHQVAHALGAHTFGKLYRALPPEYWQAPMATRNAAWCCILIAIQHGFCVPDGLARLVRAELARGEKVSA